MEPGLSRGQVIVYGGLGVVLLLLGIKALGGDQAPAADSGAVRITSEPSGSGRGGGDGLVVHVAGAVRKPGVYSLPAGSRVSHALERAGGAKPGGRPDAINLAAQLSDGQQVVVPSRSPTATAGATAGAADGPISLGSASAADLEGIEGIGPVTAEKILSFRDQQGGIGAIEELDAIPGIGPATIESLSSALQP